MLEFNMVLVDAQVIPQNSAYDRCILPNSTGSFSYKDVELQPGNTDDVRSTQQL